MRHYLQYTLSILQQASTLGLTLLAITLLALTLLARRQGKKPTLRASLQATLCTLYATGVIAITTLPLPAKDNYICPVGWGDAYPRFFLGWSYEFALRDNGSFLGAIFSIYTLQVLLNILLFLPLGLLLYWIWGSSFRTVLFTAFAASLTIELTQVTGLWGYYDCAIRTFDVEDIFSNTLGAVMGWAALAAWKNRATLPGAIRRLLGR